MATEADGGNHSQTHAGKAGMPGSGLARAWWRPPSWSRSPLLHEWIRSGGILIAAAWGVYTFVWKDILVPVWQPASISLEASLMPVPDRPTTAAGREMTLVVKAVNTSSRRVYPLANIWWLRELRREPRIGSSQQVDQRFLQDSNSALKQSPLEVAERIVTSAHGNLLAVGRLFDDDVIDPGGEVNRTILVRIPNAAAAVELQMTVPLLTRPAAGLFPAQRLAWGLDAAGAGDPRLWVCAVSGHETSGGTAPCRLADAQTDRRLKQFDPSNATITLSQQIGLPLGRAVVAPARGATP